MTKNPTGQQMHVNGTHVLGSAHDHTALTHPPDLIHVTVLQGRDPSTSVVLWEDLASVSGVFVALGCMGLSHYNIYPHADAIGSIVIGGMLAGVAGLIVYTNAGALLGRCVSN